ncbi:MAG: J domain-containing protein [Alphaproteobacteria bacterium]|nr:MAG: J domain-containing protein [Alphaproteobacteria bacterium]
MARLKKTLKPVFDEAQNTTPVCHHEGCCESAHYRAPKDRHLREYHWFCLNHVRSYNSDWNFYKGMTPGAIQSHQHADLTWQRPSWPVHEHHAKSARLRFEVLEAVGRSVQLTEEERNLFPPHTPEGKALAFFGLEYPCDFDDVKRAYKQIIKVHHPDINKNSRTSHEQMKKINEAYNVLSKTFRSQISQRYRSNS